MKVIFDSEQLSRAFDLAVLATAAKSSKPVLASVKLVVTPDGARLRSSNNEVSVDVAIDGDVRAEGECLLPAEKVGRLLRDAQDTVTIEAQKAGMKYSTRTGNAKIGTADPAEHPARSLDHVEGIEVPALTLRRLVKLTSFAIDEDSGRYALGGIRFEVDGELLHVVATDGRRLACASAACRVVDPEGWPKSGGLIVPKATFRIIDRLADSWSDDERLSSGRTAMCLGSAPSMRRVNLF